MKRFKEIIHASTKTTPKPVLVVACPYDKNILEALSMAYHEGLVKIIMLGDKKNTDKTLKQNGISFAYEYLDIESDLSAVKESYKMVLSGQADIIMKGIVQTKDFMEILLSEKSFLQRKLLTHVAIYETTALNKLIFVSDPSIIIAPTVNQKKIIIDNAIELLHCLRIEKPKVAIISSTEVPNYKIRSSIEAVELMDMYKDDHEGVLVYGPLGIDNAVSIEASRLKKIDSPVGGNADLLIMPNLDCGNIFCKGLTYMGNIGSAGIVMGAKKPIVLTSRSASSIEKLNSIAVACIAWKNKK